MIAAQELEQEACFGELLVDTAKTLIVRSHLDRGKIEPRLLDLEFAGVIL